MMIQFTADCISVPVSCKAARFLSCCTPFSSSSSSVLMFVTTSPSKPTSAIPFQKFSVSSVDGQNREMSVSGVLLYLCMIRTTSCQYCEINDYCWDVCGVYDLRFHWIPYCLQTPVSLSSSLPSHSEHLVFPHPPPHHCLEPPEQLFIWESTHNGTRMNKRPDSQSVGCDQ